MVAVLHMWPDVTLENVKHNGKSQVHIRAVQRISHLFSHFNDGSFARVPLQVWDRFTPNIERKDKVLP